MGKKPKTWQELLEDYQGIQPDAYVLYLRRSVKKKKSEQGISLSEFDAPIDKLTIEQQRDACLHVAEKRGLKIIEPYFVEEISAQTPNKRPEFNKMLEYLVNSKENLGILSWSPDRLSRNALEAGVLIHYYINHHITDFQFVTYNFSQDDSGLEYLMMEFARAMGYSLRLRKTVLRGMLHGYHENQEWQFPDKFGYQRLLKTQFNGTRKKINFFIPHEGKNGQMGEFEVVQLAFQLRLQGKTLDEIVKAIIGKGFINKKGMNGKITKQRLGGKRGILKDTFYYGLARSKLGEVDISSKIEKDDQGNIVNFIPAVTEEDFEICQTINDERKKITTQKHDNVPFRGIIRCGHCHRTIQPQSKGNKGIYYYCYNTSCQGSKGHSQSPTKKVKSGITGKQLFEEIERIIRDELKVSKREFTEYLLYIEKQNQLKKELRKTDLKRIQTQKGHIQQKMNDKTKELTNAISKIPADKTDILESIVKVHDQEIEALKNRLNQANKEEQTIMSRNHAWTQSLTKWLELMQNGYLYWKNANLDQKKFIAENIFLELEIKDGKIASYKYLEAPDALKNANLSYTGGPGWT